MVNVLEEPISPGLDKNGQKHGPCKTLQEVQPHWLIKELLQPLILSQLDYCSVICSNTTETYFNVVKVAQNEVVHIVLRCSVNDCVVWLSMKSLFSLVLVLLEIIPKTLEMLHFKLLFFSGKT